MAVFSNPGAGAGRQPFVQLYATETGTIYYRLASRRLLTNRTVQCDRPEKWFACKRMYRSATWYTNEMSIQSLEQYRYRLL